MSQQIKSADEQEIDFSVIGRKFKDAATGVESIFFRFLKLIKRNIIVIVVLFIAGAALGWYIDKTGKTYKNELIVIPNFGSTEHLYSQIDLIQSKLNEGDTAFIKSLGVVNPKKLLKIEIEPINNVYEFANQRPSNFELIKLMAEDGNINKVIEDKVTSKNYSTHRITFKTKGITAKEKTLDPLVRFFNSSAYFDTIKKQQVRNLETKMRMNDSIINQIDDIVEEFKNAPSSSARSSSLVYYNENTQLSDILKRKDELINEQASLRISKINYTAIVKNIASSLNIRDKSGLSGKMKFITPLLFIFLFIAGIAIFKYVKYGLSKNQD